MNTKRLIYSVCVFLLASTRVLGQNSGPEEVVRTFYKHDAKTSQVFNRRNLDSRKKWISTGLYNLFRKELNKQDALLKQHPDEKPFFGDGFPFRLIDERCDVNGKSYKRRYSVQAAKNQRGPHVNVSVQFSYPPPCTAAPLTYTARVIRSGAKWAIDDIVFDDGNTLSDVMRNNQY